MSTYVDDFREALRGQPLERFVVSMETVGGRYPPVILSEGDAVSCAYSRRDLMRLLQRYRCRAFACAQGHPEVGLHYPSYDDLRDAQELRQVCEAWRVKLLDFCSVSLDGLVFSYKAHGILDDPVVKGARYAKEALRPVARRGLFGGRC
jgi:hypothetical protein